jgi:SNF2 family DNA or RNA helicase
MAVKPLPTYRFDPSKAFAEAGQPGISLTQSTYDTTDKVSAYALTAAFVLSGQWFKGPLETLTMPQFHAELDEACHRLKIDTMRLIKWAQSLLLKPEDTMSPEDVAKYVPSFIEGKGFSIHPYQSRVAAWSAYRMGSVMALGCGVGKSATATASAIGAVRSGRCSDSRCYIVCPLNAMAQWQAYTTDLKKAYKDVQILSVDSLHHYKNIDHDIGGAVIFDEVHKLKNWDANRSQNAHEMRAAFEWGVCLTGTMLHTGAEGVLSMLDVACPGLSRYLDKWAFGKNFNCIIKKQVGPRIKHALGRPPLAARERFVSYLSRGVCSLSFQSEEVRKVVSLPNQDRQTIVDWEKPDWLLEIETKEKEKFFADVKSKGGTPTNEMFMMMSENRWPPDMDWRELFAAVALATMKEQVELWKSRGCTDEMGVPCPQPGLPSFPAMMHLVSKMGNTDYSLVKKDSGQNQFTYEFLYPAGASSTNPAPGPKIRWVMQWLKDNPKEPVVIGAASVLSIDLMQAELKKKRIDYRLIRGGVSSKERNKHIEGFQNGEFRVMLLQQVAGSESVTLTRASYSILIDHDWSPITYTQFLARTCRQGQTDECTHYDLAFNPLQSEIIKKLVSGEEFDAQTRKAIESKVRYVELEAGGTVNVQ